MLDLEQSEEEEMSSKTPAAPEKTLGKEILCLSNLIKRNFDSALSERGETVTPVQGQVIRYLLKNGGCDIFQRDIEKVFSYRRSTASTVLGLMEEKGLIERVAVPYDARLKKLVLTDKAMEFAAVCEEEDGKMRSRMTEGIPDEDIETALRVLSAVKTNLLKEV